MGDSGIPETRLVEYQKGLALFPNSAKGFPSEVPKPGFQPRFAGRGFQGSFPIRSLNILKHSQKVSRTGFQGQASKRFPKGSQEEVPRGPPARFPSKGPKNRFPSEVAKKRLARRGWQTRSPNTVGHFLGSFDVRGT